MAERLKAHAWKACIGETLSRVRIPLSPPEYIERRRASYPSVFREIAALNAGRTGFLFGKRSVGLDFIRYSRIANVEWKHGVEAAGRLRGAQACRGWVAPRSVFPPRARVGNESVGGACERKTRACERFGSRSRFGKSSKHSGAGRVSYAWVEVRVSRGTRGAYAGSCNLLWGRAIASADRSVWRPDSGLAV